MITHHMSLTLDLSKVKAIYINDMKLVFELDNILLKVYNEETEEDELLSFPNSPVIQEFTALDTLHDCFNAWEVMWRKFQETKK